MSVRDFSTETVAPETVPEPIAAGPAEDEATTKFSAEGALPAVATTGVGAEAASASELGFENKHRDNTLTVLGTEHGMISWEAYKHDCEVAGKPEEWKDQYVNGYTEARGWKQPLDHWTDNEFLLEKNTSASQALKDFIAGPTIADWHVAKVALDLRDLLTDVGEQKFDLLFGSSKAAIDQSIPAAQRLRISGADVVTTYVDTLYDIAMHYDARESEPVHPDEFIVAPEDKPAPPKADPAEKMVAQKDLELEQDKHPEVA
jgi:hypothetical protein